MLDEVICQIAKPARPAQTRKRKASEPPVVCSLQSLLFPAALPAAQESVVITDHN